MYLPLGYVGGDGLYYFTFPDLFLDALVGRTALYREYKSWSKATGRVPTTSQEFNKRLD